MPPTPPGAPRADSLAERKRELRRRIRTRLRAIEPSHARAVAARVAMFAARTREFRRAPRVVLYAALADELPTDPLFEAARRAGKPVLLPRAAPDAPLRFAPVTRREELRPGRYGVPEPPPDVPDVPGCELDAGDLVLVPGIAFDREGNRLGRGGGHYDRTFGPGGRSGARRRPTLFGVAFELQLVDEVPHGPHDGRVDAVITERGVWRGPGRGGAAVREDGGGGGPGGGGPEKGPHDRRQRGP